jgi:hypothetical protein
MSDDKKSPIDQGMAPLASPRSGRINSHHDFFSLQGLIGETVTIPKVSMIEIDKRLGVLLYQNAMLLEALKGLYDNWYDDNEPLSEWGKRAKRAIEMCGGSEIDTLPTP